MAILILKYQEIAKKEGYIFINIEYGDIKTGREHRKCLRDDDPDVEFQTLKGLHSLNGISLDWDKYKKPVLSPEEKAEKGRNLKALKHQRYLDDLARKAKENG